MSELAGPTWRRLKSCLEYKYRDIDVPATGHDDRLKQLGLLVGLRDGDKGVLRDEGRQLSLGEAEAGDASDAELAEKVHDLAKRAPLEDYVR